MCPTSDYEAKLSFVVAGKPYFKSSNKISYSFYDDVKKKTVSFIR